MKIRVLSKQLLAATVIVTGAVTVSCNSGQSQEGGGIFDNISEAFSSEVTPETINKILQEKYPQSSDSAKADPLRDLNAQMHRVYAQNNTKPLWLEGRKFGKQATELIKAIEDLKWDGLDPETYGLSELKKAVAQKDASDEALASGELAFTASYLSAARDLTLGVLNPAEIDKEWHADNDSTLTTADDLAKAPKDISFQKYRPANPRYALMQKELQKWDKLRSDTAYQQSKTAISAAASGAAIAIMQKELASSASDTDMVKTYQYLNHLSKTGKIDEETIKVLHRSPDEYVELLKINMERLRWLPNAMEGRYIWVSIPQTEIDYYKDGNNLFHNRSVVGAKITRTPTILKPMQNIVICPPWTLPLSIVGKEYGGRIPSYYEVYQGGKRVPNSAVNASNYRRFTVRQPAGPRAALGYVKFNLPNQWDIYLHDTPGRYVFANKNRYLSHGCVRVKDPKTLAALILEESNVGVDSINVLISRNRTRQFPTPKIPVYITYTTVNADSALQKVIYLNDPYKKDSVILARLK